MTEFKRVDWEKMGDKLKELRVCNPKLRAKVCSYLHAVSPKEYDKCDLGDCAECRGARELQISQKELGEMLGVSGNVVANWENARTPIDIDVLLQYSAICETSLEDLLCYCVK